MTIFNSPARSLTIPWSNSSCLNTRILPHQPWPETIPVDRHRHRDRETRLPALAHGLLAATEIDIKEHDRLALARKMMKRKLEGHRTSSKLPELVELVMARSLVSAGMAEKMHGVTP
jgi:hypothetical protein